MSTPLKCDIYRALMKKLILSAVVFGVITAHADTLEVFERPSRPLQVELGVNIGTPALLNFSLGLWGPDSFPILARVSGGYLAYTAGFGGELGYIFDNEGSFRQYLALGAETGAGISPTNLDLGEYAGIGPHYGFNWGGFTVDFGILYGTGTYGNLVRATLDGVAIQRQTGIIPVLNLGFSFLL